jgi:hypothetical protein
VPASSRPIANVAMLACLAYISAPDDPGQA